MKDLLLVISTAAFIFAYQQEIKWLLFITFLAVFMTLGSQGYNYLDRKINHTQKRQQRKLHKQTW